jgi:hypothetical protein
MPVAIGRRTLSPEEARDLSSPTWRLWLMAVPGVLGRFLPFFVLAMLLMMVVMGSLDSVLQKIPKGSTPHFWQKEPPPFVLFLFIACVWGPVFALPAYFTYRGFRAQVRRHRARRADLLGGEAWLIHATAPAFVEIVDDREDSLYLLDLGDGRTLLIDGARIEWDFELFGLPTPEEEFDDESDEFDEASEVDSERPPLRTPFPNSDFVLHWLPNTGRILRIESRGEAAVPSRVVLGNEVTLAEANDFLVDPDKGAIVIGRRIHDVVPDRVGSTP